MRFPVQAAPVQRASRKSAQIGNVVQSGCNWLACGVKAVTCAAACVSGVGTVGCISCLGSAYDTCKSCFE